MNNPIIVLGGIALSHVYIHDNGFLKNNLQLVSDKLKEDQRFIWDFDVNSRSYIEKFSRSKSSYEKITFREIVASARINSTYIEEQNKSGEEETFLKHTEIYFYKNGNVVILTKYPFNATFRSIEQYEDSVKQIHLDYKLYIKEIFYQSIIKYVEAFKTIKHPSIIILSEPLDKGIKDKVLRFSIMNHFINDDYQNPVYKDIFKDCEYLPNNQEIILDDLYIRLGWTHSLFISQNIDFSMDEHIDFYSMYLRTILANWSALESLRYHVSRLESYYYTKIETKEISYKEIIKKREEFKEFILKIEDTFITIDSYQATNHPIAKHVLSMYQKVFEEKQAAKRVKKQIASLTNKIDFMYQKQKSDLDQTMNITLFVIALLSVINAADLVYKIIFEYKLFPSIFISVISLVSLMIILYYVLKHKK
ncbi:MAG: hypothetical protein AB7E61_07605 [Acholeplasmataceae bacterium]